MDLTTKGYFRIYLGKYKLQNSSFSLDEAKYNGDKNLKNAKTKIEFVSDSSNTYDNNLFSSNMMKVLSSLSSEDLEFIKLKYQENYSNGELSEYYNLSLEEINQKELNILSLLRNNNNIKLLKKQII